MNRSVNRDKKNHYDDIYKLHVENKDVGGLYKTAKTQVGWTKNTSPTSFIIEGTKVTDPQKMADIQIENFCKQDKENFWINYLLLQSTPVRYWSTLSTSGVREKKLESSSNFILSPTWRLSKY